MIPAEDLSEGDLRLLEVDNPIYLPTNAHVRLSVTPDDVLHCRTIPSLGVKVDACPGRLNQTSIFTNREGRYYGQCSEIRGVNHGSTPICVKAVPLDTYISRVSSQFDEKTNTSTNSSPRYAKSMQTLLLDSSASIALTCAMGVIVSTNPIHSVISPILVSRNATGLLIVLSPKIESIAATFSIIYVGAIAVPFPLVVMMLNVRAAESQTNWLRYVGSIIILYLLIRLAAPGATFEQLLQPLSFPTVNGYALPALTNIQSLGYLIHTHYSYYFPMASSILPVAMIGAIVSTMHKRKNAYKKQFVFQQVARRFEDAICYAA
jgi:NADH:ubiquinone oxidoreductase subunit 6 (subunit J)